MGARVGEVASRRSFFRRGLLVVLVGFGKRVFAQASRALRFRPLARPVLIPTEDLKVRWRSRQFTADAVTLPSAPTPNQPIRVSGMVVRTGDSEFAAVCLRCPHELCDVDYISNPASLAKEIVDEIGHPVDDPVYVCPCHNSTFKVDGDRLAGPAPRGLYRFRVTATSETSVEVGEVEEDVLIFV
jgi:Rieske Fe-S protein